jgi:hypothetical protein
MAGGTASTLARAIATALMTLVVAGCGFMTQSSVSSASCGNMSGGACDEQIAAMEKRHPGARSIDIECSAPVCDRRAGQGTVVVTMQNGARLNDTFAYVGDPNPLPPPACTGVPLDACRNLATQEAGNMPPSQRIVATQVSCTAAAGCTAESGTASISITLGDGSTHGTETSWEGGEP